MTFTLRLLSEHRYATFVRWLDGEGNGSNEAGREATCIATLKHPDCATAKPFYVKLYPDMSGRSRGLINEVAGYVLADRFGIPQPPRACLLRVPLKKLDLAALPKRHAWVKALARAVPTYPAFCTEAVSAQTPWQHYGPHAAEAMKADVRAWSDHMKTLAFDDIIANVDRHMNNLLRTGESRYAVIDHGRLVTGDGHWSQADLNPGVDTYNRLLHLLYKDPADAGNGMVAAADAATILLAGLAEIRHWGTAIVRDEAERRAFDSFLQLRTIAAPTRIAARYVLC